MLIIEYAIERSKAEILEDMAHGPVPVTVASFSELHDYVDANEYGGLCEDGFWTLPEDATDKEIADNDGFYLIGKHLDLANAVQDAVNLWITSGDARRAFQATDAYRETYQECEMYGCDRSITGSSAHEELCDGPIHDGPYAPDLGRDLRICYICQDDLSGPIHESDAHQWMLNSLSHLERVWESYDLQPKAENGRSNCCNAECVIVLKTDDGRTIESCSKCRNMVDTGN